MKKIPNLYIAFCVIAVTSLICGVMISEVGKLTLLNEVFSILTISCAIVTLIKVLILALKDKKVSNILLTAVLVLVIGAVLCVTVVDTVGDFVTGPRWVTLSECSVEKRGTSKGIFGLNYYLKGEDSTGKSYRFSVSGKEYQSLNGKEKVSVLCYENTGRIVEIKLE